MLNALFYPAGTKEKPIPFESLYIPYIYKEIYFDGIYVDIFNTGRDMTILDVGANIGVVTQYMRQYAKKVYAIEPSPEHFEALQKNKEFNNWDNVETFNLALADKDGEMEFTVNPNNRTMNGLIIKEGGRSLFSPTDLTYKVKTMGFDTFLEQNKIEKVDFCKFDVEGAEELILRSDGFKKIAHRIKAIEVEFHYPDWPQLVNYMIDLGFTPRRYNCSAIVILFTR